MFVVDSAIFQKEVRDVAEFLYDLLTDIVISRNAPAIIVACNKQGKKTTYVGSHSIYYRIQVFILRYSMCCI